ncbi:Lipid A biosynthesis lauroyltransferase [bacterium HR40]|nr:Lipid A biosynthesis lauroyltransferase [bacterium HR40]
MCGEDGSTTVAKHFLGRTLERWARPLPFLRHPLWTAEAALAAGVLALSRSLRPAAASNFGERLGRMLGPKSYKHRHVLTNLAIAFPGRDPAWYEETARAIWGNLGRVLAEFAFLERFLEGELAERVEIVDHASPHLRNRRQQIIFVGAHLANWELAALVPNRWSLPVTVVHARQTNPLLDRLIARRRQALRARLVAVGESARLLPKALAEGHSLGLLVDQRFDDGELVPFFGREAQTAVTPARLALRHGLPLVPVRVERLDGLDLRITVYEPIEPEAPVRDRREAALAMTARLNRLFEDWIRARPGEWLCAKRRWPKGPEDPKLRANRRRAVTAA